MPTIDEYLSYIKPEYKTELERIRNLVRMVVPDATEGFTYGMPAFSYKGAYLIGFAAFKEHLGLFPTPKPIEILAGKLTGYKTSKGAIHFTPENPIPDALLKEILVVRLKVITQMSR